MPGGETAVHFQGEVVKVGGRSGIRAGGHRKLWEHCLVFFLFFIYFFILIFLFSY